MDPQSGVPTQRPGQNNQGTLPQSLGVQVVPITPQLGAQLGVDVGTPGLVITDVDPNSDAGAKGVTPGTVILGANGRAVATAEELEAVVSAAKASGREAVLLRVRPRNGLPVSVAVRLR